MHQVLVYSDSLSWGIIPMTRRRLPFDERWPGVMEQALNQSGQSVRVIEDCLNGQRTVFEDPFKPGRNGLTGLAQRIEINSPLALVNAIRQAPIEPGMPVPPVMIVAPPPIGTVTQASAVDGIHLDADQHRTLGKALAANLAKLPVLS